jgi:FKBP-type peptidyl-prolyl cis-trans isomerase SlpA
MTLDSFNQDATPLNPSRAIELGSFVTLHYKVEQINHGSSQQIVTTFGGTPVTLAIGQGQLSPILEDKLIGLTEQDIYPKIFEVENAFGLHDLQLVRSFAIADLESYGIEANLTTGDLVRFNFEHLPKQKIQSEISEVSLKQLPPVIGACFIKYENDLAFFDFNHPLAGQTLVFTVEILSVL